MHQIPIEESWKKLLSEEFKKPYFVELSKFIKDETLAGKTIYPPQELIYTAFNITPVEKVKIVILGQDPYHNLGQAMGLSFSVPRGVRTPPSLKTVYKELNTDLGCPIANHGDLTKWANQGVLLLNAMLTVEKNNAGSHKKSGWQKFTDAALEKLSNERENLIFMLWGGFAKKKIYLIDENKHLVLEAAHPSPLARGAYYGSKHFSQANAYLKSLGKEEIDWCLGE